MNNVIEGFISVSDAAKKLRWKASEVYPLVRKEVLEAVKIGSTWLIVEESLNKFMEGLK